ncbi:MAG: hypothetical protein R3E39_28730 [Anaerolineae bacterium]
MTDLDELIADIHSRVTEIATHVARLPAADEVSDAIFVRLENLFDRNIQTMFDILDKASSIPNNMRVASKTESISEVARMLRFDLNPSISNMINVVDIMQERFAGQLSAEQKESLLSIKRLSETLLARLRSLAGYDAQFN